MTDSLLLETSINNASGDEIPERQLAVVLDFAYRAKRKKPATMDLLVTTDVEISKLNRRHLGEDNATDVLAFEDGDVEDGKIRLGDVVISADTARRVAQDRGGDYIQELTFYALHGMLHLLGMRDDTDAERLAMLRAQARAMRDFGFAVPENIDTLE